MQVVAEQLRAVGLGVFPCSITFNYAKNKYEKHPLTYRGESWQETAKRTDTNWTGIKAVGVPIPAGVVILDLDLYNPGVTLAGADATLGGGIPWDAALIQTTVSGGSHYAFRLPAWDVKQGSNLGGKGSGIDTRVGGKGFICSGEGYAPADQWGVLRMGFPDALPVLPDQCRAVLEHAAPETGIPATPHTPTTHTDAAAAAALAHVDPTERDMWRDVGYALKHEYGDEGFEVWDAWSAGEYWPDGAPDAYDGDSQRSAWDGFKASREGGTSITIGTLYHYAMVGGWTPPARFDSASAFGADAAPATAFRDVIQQIRERGADVSSTEEIVQLITSSGCNEMQALLLRNELKAELKSAKLLDRDLSAAINDRLSVSPRRTVASGAYSKNDTENAALFLSSNYPDGTLMRCDEVWYGYDGKSWVEIEDAGILHQVTMAMAPSLPQSSAINGARNLLASTVYAPGVKMNEDGADVVLFQNAALDLKTGAVLPHSPHYLTTKILPYAYTPTAAAPSWERFVHEVFEGDTERVALLQEWLGYMLSPSYQYQKIMLMVGPRRAGKSIIGRILLELVGGLNYSGASLESFADDDFMDSLRGKTVAFSGDTAKNINKHLVERVIERIKKISGGDVVDFKRKYKSRWSGTLPTRIMLSANHIPRLFDDSEALSHRMLVLPFDVSYADREDPYLVGRLLAEREGIAVWALRGLARLNAAQRFTVPRASADEMAFIAEAYSPLKAFTDSCCVLDGATTTSSAELYDAYRAWALNEQEPHILARKVFISAFKDLSRGRGCKYGTQRRGADVFRGFRGVAINTAVTAAAFAPALTVAV